MPPKRKQKLNNGTSHRVDQSSGWQSVTTVEAHVQTKACTTYLKGTRNTDSEVPSVCRACSAGKKHGPCRFQNIRVLDNKDPTGCTFCPGIPIGDLRYPTTFRKDDTLSSVQLLATIDHMQGQLIEHVEEVLRIEETYEQKAGLIRRYPETDGRALCDTCGTPILSAGDLCVVCGIELCPACFERNNYNSISCTRPSDDHHFRPVSRLEKGVCQKIRHEIEQARIRLPDVPQNNVVTDRVSGIALEAEFPYRRVPVLNANDESSFRYLWAKRLPVHIKKVDVKGIWTPEHLSQTHGNDDVKVIDSRYCTLQNKKLSNFLTELTALGEGEPDHVVKLRDYPPALDFCTEFTEYFDDFQDSLPIPACTCAKGVENLASHWPHAPKSGPSPQAVTQRPDLGPKMYFASPDIVKKGSTRLHKDGTSAVNLLPYSLKSGKRRGGADWMVFAAEDAARLTEFLKTRLGHEVGDADPTQGSRVFIDDTLLEELKNEKIKPFLIHQEEGDVVFIPAGCPHQVSNNSSCIKIATDFLTVDDIASTKVVSAEFDAEGYDDFVRLSAMIWHCWNSLVGLRTRTSEKLNNAVSSTREKSVGELARRARNRASKDKEGKLSKTIRCPDVRCRKRDRLFHFDGLTHHAKQVHGVQIPIDQKSKFTDGSLEQNKDLYNTFVL